MLSVRQIHWELFLLKLINVVNPHSERKVRKRRKKRKKYSNFFSTLMTPTLNFHKNFITPLSFELLCQSMYLLCLVSNDERTIKSFKNKNKNNNKNKYKNKNKNKNNVPDLFGVRSFVSREMSEEDSHHVQKNENVQLKFFMKYFFLNKYLILLL